MKKPKLNIGSFYKAYGGPAHPALIIAYDSKHKTYISLKFGTSQGSHMTEIHPIQKGYSVSYVRNRPFEGTIDDYGSKELLGLYIDERDSALLEAIKTRTPDRSSRARKRYKK